MRVTYDAEVDAATVDFETGKDYESSAEIAPGFIVDFDNQGAVISLDILDAQKNYPSIFKYQLIAPQGSPGKVTDNG